MAEPNKSDLEPGASYEIVFRDALFGGFVASFVGYRGGAAEWDNGVTIGPLDAAHWTVNEVKTPDRS